MGRGVRPTGGGGRNTAAGRKSGACSAASKAAAPSWHRVMSRRRPLSVCSSLQRVPRRLGRTMSVVGDARPALEQSGGELLKEGGLGLELGLPLPSSGQQQRRLGEPL